METIKKENCIKIGQITRPFSLSGEMVLHIDAGIDDCIANASIFFVEIDNLLVPFFPIPDSFYFKAEDIAVISFDNIDTKEKAHQLDSHFVFISKKEYGESSQFNETPFIEGFTVTDIQWGEIGIVSEINNYNGNIILSVLNNDREILIPFNNDLIIKIEENKKNLIIQCDKSLLFLNNK